MLLLLNKYYKKSISTASGDFAIQGKVNNRLCVSQTEITNAAKANYILYTKELYRNVGDDFESISSPNLGRIGQVCRTGAIRNDRAIFLSN